MRLKEIEQILRGSARNGTELEKKTEADTKIVEIVH